MSESCARSVRVRRSPNYRTPFSKLQPMNYQRARSPEHKEQRREAILAAARELAAERSVRAVSLGDIARAVALAKSNLLRYFESREEIFLTLLRREWQGWRDAAAATPDAAGLAHTLAERPLFC